MTDEQLNAAFDEWWSRLGRNTPRPRGTSETDEQYRERSARCAFLAASVMFIFSGDNDGL
jgi:hypothetical protein